MVGKTYVRRKKNKARGLLSDGCQSPAESE
uniref:Uncharacterized protein n=1 Tax=Arundo donax TaxID=35708 RepID=A0A0A9AI10_ARUDO